MLIYGWGYFNRRDHGVVRTSCPACYKRGHFKSYTSSKFFTLYFVPVIPLGTEKIISECPHCKRALTMPLREWTKLKNIELPALLAKYEATPADEVAAAKLLDALSRFHGRPTLRRVGPQIRAAFARNPTILAQLAGACSRLCLDKEADAIYLEAVALSSDEELATAASTHLELQKTPKPKPPHRLWQSLPVMIVPAILVLLFGSYVQNAVTAHPEDAYLLSGLDHPYSVLINGTPVTLKPHQRIPAGMLRFGENKLAPYSGGDFIAATTFDIDVPWYRRAFDDSLVVVNPDQAAVLLWERVGYAYPKVPDNDTGGHFLLSSGASHHVYQDIDFPFRIFPDTIQTPKDGSVVYRTRVSDLNQREPQKVVQILLEEKQTSALHGYLRAKLRSPDCDATVIYLGANFLPREEFLALTESRLSIRPVEIEWHRAYQTLVEHTPDGTGLIDRYRAYTAQEPDDSSLVYLYGRVVEDLDESRALFERAVQMGKPSAHAANALAYYHLLEGDFSRALEYSRQALNLEPASESFKGLRNTALLGGKAYDTLEQEAGDLLAEKNPAYAAFYDHVYRLGKLGRADQAEAEISHFMVKLGKIQPMDTAARLQGEGYLKTALACAQHDREALALTISRLEGTSWDFQKAVLAKDLTAAAKIVEKDPASAGLPGRLVLYSLFAQANQPDAASAQLKSVVAELAEGVSDQKLWAGWLSDSPAPDPRVAAHTCYDMDFHYLYLSALAHKHPARAGEYLARASAIKTQDSFHSLAIGDLRR